ncbi:hypothetical protein [uncultured Roseibium sp.]|uniref:hypothetical protein n=1 Tax=uncultured Roseibium sp. TaxID=1936171 RepID=UPI002604832F|nr:hypothetical protein [uncultured Roseibium sp.]
MPLLNPPLPKVRLSRLRDIGWSKWDRTGLLGEGQNWTDENCSMFADDYDSYLMQAASQLRRGVSEETVVGYLVKTEADHMGLGTNQGTFTRAKAVVAAIQADDQLWAYKG